MNPAAQVGDRGGARLSVDPAPVHRRELPVLAKLQRIRGGGACASMARRAERRWRRSASCAATRGMKAVSIPCPGRRADRPEYGALMDQKRLFLAIAVSLAILLGFQLLVAPHLPKPPPRADRADRHDPVGDAGWRASPGAAGAAPPRPPSRAEDVPRVKIDAPRVEGSISLLGARLDDLVLKDYREEIAPGLARWCGCWSRGRTIIRTTSNMAGPPRPARRQAAGQRHGLDRVGRRTGAGQARHAVLGQRRRADLPDRACRSMTTTCSRSARR